jgi:hypothetical protein
MDKGMKKKPSRYCDIAPESLRAAICWNAQSSIFGSVR